MRDRQIEKAPEMTNLVLDSLDYCVEEAIDYIDSFITDENCENISIDISKYNFLEATNICILSSTSQFTQRPDNKITWIVNYKSSKRISSISEIY